jgi:hypothetical protein
VNYNSPTTAGASCSAYQCGYSGIPTAPIFAQATCVIKDGIVELFFYFSLFFIKKMY